MRDERVSSGDFRSIPLSKIKDMPACLGWINRALFGSEGLKWARRHVQTHQIRTTERLLHDIALLWPNTIVLNEVLPFGSVRKFLSPQFIESAPPRQIVEYAYHLGLSRPPDAPGLSHHQGRISKGIAPAKVVSDIILSEEADHIARRTILTNTILKELKAEAMARSSTILFKKPTSILQGFFESRANTVGYNETKSEWHFLHKDTGRNRVILSPGMNLAGQVDADGHVLCGTDWVLYGPKISLSAGRYEVSIALEAPENFRYHLDAAHGGGVGRVLDMTLAGSLDIRTTVDVRMDLQDFEIRILNLTGKRTLIDLRSVSIRKV